MVEQQRWKKHSILNLVSYGFGDFFQDLLNMSFGSYVFFFYETEVHLDSLWVMSAYILYAIWNAVNDPLMGYLTDRPFKFTRKWGRRFPWIMMGGFPTVLCYFLLFTVPKVDPEKFAWLLFLYLLIISCLFDTFFSMWGTNFMALFPDKYRIDDERRKASVINTIIANIGVASGMLVPPMFIEFGVPETYVTAGLIVLGIGMVGLIIQIPGVRDNPETVKTYLETYNAKEAKSSFFEELKFALSQRNFNSFIFYFFCYQVLTNSMTASIPYAVEYILHRPADDTIFLYLGFFIGGLVSVPLWYLLAQKLKDNRKIMIIGGLITSVSVIPLIWVEGYIPMVMIIAVFGIGLGAFWVMIQPVMSATIDEIVIKRGIRKEGIYNGFKTFFGTLSIVVQSVSFGVIHRITNFDSELGGNQLPSAVKGIQLHFGLIPAIFMMAGVLIFWKFNNLKPKRVAEIKQELLERNL